MLLLALCSYQNTAQENEQGTFELLQWDATIRWGQVVCTTQLKPAKQRGCYQLPEEEMERIEGISKLLLKAYAIY